METSAHYFRIGIFVVLLTIALIVAMLWLSVGLSHVSYQTYTIYMNESVSGLSQDAAVKYNGVQVGQVDDISLAKHNPQLVELEVKIDESVPIYTDTKAVLETQGLTGIAYLELRGGTPGGPKLKTQKGEKYPVIGTEPSLLFRLDNAIDALTENLGQISEGLQTILTPENTKALSNLMKNISASSNSLPKLVTSMENLSTHLNDTNQQALDTIQNFNAQVLPKTVNALSNLETITNNLKDFSQDVSDNPSVLLRGKQNSVQGPGE